MPRAGRYGGPQTGATLHARRHPQHEPPGAVEGVYVCQRGELFRHNWARIKGRLIGWSWKVTFLQLLDVQHGDDSGLW